MSETNKQVVVRLFDQGIQQGDLAALDELFAETVDYEGPAGGRGGREGFRDFITALHAGLEGIRCNIEQVIAEGDQVAARVSITGMNVGEWETMAPSRREVCFTMVAIAEVKDGRITRYVDARDNISIWLQVGDVPAHLRHYAEAVQV